MGVASLWNTVISPIATPESPSCVTAATATLIGRSRHRSRRLGFAAPVEGGRCFNTIPLFGETYAVEVGGTGNGFGKAELRLHRGR